MIIRPKILIVDDREENLIALRSTLKEIDVEVIEANNGNDALTATLNHNFAVAILDVQMPGMDGYELADLMQGDTSTDKIPVIFLTANYSGEDKISKGYETGAVDFLVKPYDPFILLSKINVFLTLFRQRAELKNYSEHLAELVAERTSELDEAVQDLKRLNFELEQFTTIAAHDLQEPLRRVSSYSQLLEKKYKDKIDSEANEIIGYIVDGAKHLQEMILDLHDYVNIKTNGGVFKEIDLNNCIKNVIRDLKKEISETGTTIKYDPLPVVKGDEQQLSRLFFNLISNSIKFRGVNAPLITIVPSDNKEYWQIDIGDNGIGIEPQYYDLVFQIFSTLHPKVKYGGRGIGLSIAKRIVERHNGKIWVESGTDCGTTVVLTLKK